MGEAITVDSTGNIYVSGRSYTSWGTPVNPHTGGTDEDVFVAKLNGNGVYQWHTFMYFEDDTAIATDGTGNVYVAGTDANFPVSCDAFVAQFSSSDGVRQWLIFIGGAGNEYGKGVAIDGSGNVYVAGYGTATWGYPVNPHAGGGADAFVAKLNSSGTMQWHTFMGSSNIYVSEKGNAIAVDGNGNVTVAGTSGDTWGTPVNPYSGGNDAFVAQLDSNGERQWHTFMGSTSSDSGNAIAIDGSGNVSAAGTSNATWGTPVNPYAGGNDAFVSHITVGTVSNSYLLWTK